MRWTVNNIMILLEELTGKNQSDSISAKDLFYRWNSEQAMYFQDVVGRWQARANGKSGANTGLILNEISLTELAPFTIPTQLTVSSGNADKPEDFEYMVALRVGPTHKCQLIKPGQIAAVSSSVIDPPSITDSKYYAIEYENYYSFLPSAIVAADLDYIASPTDVVWGFSFDGDGRQIYNPGSSVQPKWSNATIITITKRTLNAFGVAWKDADFANAGKSAQVTGE